MSDKIEEPGIFGSQLQVARKKREISQQDLAKKTGLPASSISHFEGGGRKPSVANLGRLASALNVSTDFLLGRSTETGTASAASKLQKHLNKLNDYDLDIAERFIEVLASKSESSEDDKA